MGDLASARGPDHQGGGEGRQGSRAGGGEGRQGHLRACVWQKVAAPPRSPRLAKVLTIYSTIVLCRVRGRATCTLIFGRLMSQSTISKSQETSSVSLKI